MCWIGFKIEDIACRKAEDDIVVYKLVLDATKDSCKSAFKDYLYNTNVQPIIKLGISLPFMLIHKGYHSYTNIKYTKEKDNTVSVKFTFPDSVPSEELSKYYLAKFIIPKGSVYYKNVLDHVVSSSIRYTGEYYKITDYSALSIGIRK